MSHSNYLLSTDSRPCSAVSNRDGRETPLRATPTSDGSRYNEVIMIDSQIYMYI